MKTHYQFWGSKWSMIPNFNSRSIKHKSWSGVMDCVRTLTLVNVYISIISINRNIKWFHIIMDVSSILNPNPDSDILIPISRLEIYNNYSYNLIFRSIEFKSPSFHMMVMIICMIHSLIFNTHSHTHDPTHMCWYSFSTRPTSCVCLSWLYYCITYNM